MARRALLDFEKPLVELEEQIEQIRQLARDSEVDVSQQLLQLETLATRRRREIFESLSPAQKIQVARHPQRPSTLDYIQVITDEWVELHGDRRFADDHAIVTGMAQFRGEPVFVLGHQKGRDTQQKIFRNFGYARPEGYRKALRVMKMAEKFKRPVIVFVDTPAAYPGAESEERGVAEAIALNLREMALLDTPIVVLVCGEGGSGGALGIAIGDRVLMQEFSMYSVIPPEGCASILWRDGKQGAKAAEALRLAAPDLEHLGIVDGVLPEPVGGAHRDAAAAAATLKAALIEQLDALAGVHLTFAGAVQQRPAPRSEPVGQQAGCATAQIGRAHV